MAKRPFSNKLNDLDPKEWIKFQKSWFIHNPPPRRKDVLRHPAKFPETIAEEFIRFFTKQNQVVFDPMVGTGSTLIAALRASRNSYGIEINPGYAKKAHQLVEEEKSSLSIEGDSLLAKIITGDASHLSQYIETFHLPKIDYVFTSPPYWNMLRERGAMTQKNRRENPELDVFYSDDLNDLGNIEDYSIFLNRLCSIYETIQPFLRGGAYLTIIVKNIKKKGVVYPLAWDLGRKLGTIYTLKDEKIWLQDNQPLAPYGIGSAWVSNTFHHYCLQFRNE